VEASLPNQIEMFEASQVTSYYIMSLGSGRGTYCIGDLELADFITERAR
jgi:hypothetical protein